jgi:hypothetical protein
MNPTPSNPPSTFTKLKFLWDQHELQIMRADTADEMMEDSLGQLLYVDDYSSLPPEAQKYIDDEQTKLNQRLFDLSLVSNVIGQSAIIAIDRVIKSVSQNVVDAKKGPMVLKRTSILENVDSPQIYWAYAVRCAANYVRHAGEWKSEAVTFRANNANFPALSDFQRTNTRSNLAALSKVLSCNIEHLIERDCTHSLAERLDLLKEQPLETLFQAWKDAQ